MQAGGASNVDTLLMTSVRLEVLQDDFSGKVGSRRRRT